MIQYYLDLKKQVNLINELRLAHGQIQKIYSTSFFISFSIRTPGKTWHIYLGRGSGQEGLWAHDKAPPSALRRRDRFLEYLRKHISSCSFLSLELDQHDRIIKLCYQKFGKVQSFLVFYKARKLYFIHHFQEEPEGPFKLAISWHKKSVILNQGPDNLYEYFNEVGRRTDMQHDLSSANFLEITELLDAELRAAQAQGMTSSPTFIQRKIENIEKDLVRARQWKQLQKVLDRGVSLEEYELKVGDHKLKFPGDLNPYERRNLLFEKIKKLKRGENILGQRLKTAQEELQGKVKDKKIHSALPISKPVWGVEDNKEKKNAVNAPEKEEYKLFKFDHFSIGVGLSSFGNDQLRNKWATKEDYWIHLDGHKSAHVIIKLDRLSSLGPEVIHLAASILASFSQFSGEWVPIIFTQVKNLKGVTGSSGMVIYKKEKHLKCPRVDNSQWLKE